MTGKLTVIIGAMGSGKTEELIRRVRDTHSPSQVFKPRIDDRFDTTSIKSRNGFHLDNVILIDEATDVLTVAHEGFIIVVDECQFVKGIARAAEILVEDGMNLIFAGLPSDFRGQPFGEMGDLLAIADDIIHVKATCKVCGGTATKTQRLINGEPAHYDDPIVMVGGNELYEPRCTKHWVVRRG